MQINSMRDLVAFARGRRLELGLTQTELARRAHVSRQWIGAFEAGKSTAEIGLAIRLLDALGLRLDLVASEDPAADRGGRRSTDLDALLEEYGER